MSLNKTFGQEKGRDGLTDGLTDGQTDGRTDGPDMMITIVHIMKYRFFFSLLGYKKTVKSSLS